jgi:precorrin-6Y C5,15-methyltransferase (decarboxylating)
LNVREISPEVKNVYVVGIGFKPLEDKTRNLILGSDVILANNSLVTRFARYPEYESVKDRILVHGSAHESVDYIQANYLKKKLILLAGGDPMFFGVGPLMVEKLGPEAVEILPDLSCVQVAFSRIQTSSSNALMISLHGGPVPEKRRKQEYDVQDLPSLVENHSTIAILTDKINSPEKIAEVLSTGHQDIRMYVCEKLGFEEEQVIEGAPDEMSLLSFNHPNVVIIKRTQMPNKNK